MSNSDDVRIATALDTASVVEDYLGSLLALTRGDVDRGGAPRKFERARRALHLQERSVVRGFAFGYGSEQLRKASAAARDLASAVDDLERADAESTRSLARQLRDLGLVELQAQLADEQLTVRSPVLGEAFERLHSAMGTIRRAQVANALARMRAERPGETSA